MPLTPFLNLTERPDANFFLPLVLTESPASEGAADPTSDAETSLALTLSSRPPPRAADVPVFVLDRLLMLSTCSWYSVSDPSPDENARSRLVYISECAARPSRESISMIWPARCVTPARPHASTRSL